MCLQFSSELCIQTAAKNEHSPNAVTDKAICIAIGRVEWNCIYSTIMVLLVVIYLHGVLFISAISITT